VEPLSDLIATTERQTLQFFFSGLKDVSDAEVDERELLYAASVLAHYALTSTGTAREMPAPHDLSHIFDHFVLSDLMHGDSQMMETAAAQCLLLAGFFEGQMRGRHSIRWYADLGSGFYRRAALLAEERRRAALLDAVGRHFEPWRMRCARLSRELHVQRYLIAQRGPHSAS
jgi:hypothetical protein